ncbi:lipoyl(octanoyl) transferase LipB [Aristophania vespae]|uniref:Octanoyltransferase n=1 Tax=Aristophania vespae TaxID=2697033 RepID=A0A6P1NDW0_9PROT|nr:lipoyl(octanoyl) transferase LipB [Aristophania vespae]QHI95679.1 lipoyl(octanoyl) transferase LipB [Aristophania vespae]UMM63366.1 Octanoyltransferase [Aristophania vespae]
MTNFSEEIFLKRDLNLCPYQAAIDKMQHIVDGIQKGTNRQTAWFTSHPPLFTAGTSAKKEDLLNPKNYPTFNAGRGGQWTYHGPGQRIAYLMMDLTKPHGVIAPRDIRSYVTGLENWLINSLKLLNIDAFTRENRVGVWCYDPITKEESKIAAIGIRISRWVSWHGISLNVRPNLEDFEGIIPCGIREFGVTSLERFYPDIQMDKADSALIESWPHIFGSNLKEM